MVLAGDGTLNRVVQVLAQTKSLSKITLGILPFGTCNDFSKTIGLKKGEWLPLASSILTGKTRKFRVARVNGYFFINNAGFGRQPTGKKSNAVKDIQSLKPIHAKLFWGDQQLEGNFLMMVCANAPYFSNGLHFSLDSDPTDLLLEFFFVGKMNKMKLITKFILGKRGRSLSKEHGERSILKIQTSQLTLETTTPIWVMRDGENSSELSSIHQAAFSIGAECRFLVP